MVALAVLPIIAVLALVVDLGMVLVRRQELQAGVESAVLAGAARWSSGPCSQAAGLVDANVDTPAPIDVQCRTTNSAGGGRVVVQASVDQPLTFGSLLGHDTVRVSAGAGAMVGSAAYSSGLRPLGLCAQHPAVLAWVSSGFTDTAIHRIYIQSDGVTCGGTVPGNWAMIDFDAGGNSNAELQDRVVNGYQGKVVVPSTLPGDPGIPSPAVHLGSIIGKTVTLPVFGAARPAGGNSEYDLTGFVGVSITAVQDSGAAASRYVELRFKRLDAGQGPTGSGGGFGVSSWQMCSFDEVTTC